MEASTAAWMVGYVPGTFKTLEALAGTAARMPVASSEHPAAENARK